MGIRKYTSAQKELQKQCAQIIWSYVYAHIKKTTWTHAQRGPKLNRPIATYKTHKI